MNLHRTTITALLATATLGLGACGGTSDTGAIRRQADQIRTQGAALQKQGAQISKTAAGGGDTSRAERDLAAREAAAAKQTKAVADDALDVVKDKAPDDATKKAIEDVQNQIEPVTTP